ncbi:MAG: T9SS type A sorting domain-containing protein [Saprospiraceae bacterium]|nr:T9SS type A sorting domain-containing protein [Saprospiraceae bacterium]
MKNVLLICAVAFIALSETFAQYHKCGVTKEADALIKQRLMQNRAMFTKQEVSDLMNNRTITYIPISFHSVSNSSGEGAATEREIMDFLCGLNGLYASQDLQFFIYDQIHFRTSNNIDDNAGSNASAVDMYGWTVPQTLNITIGRSQNNPTSSWYSGFGDYIFLLKQMMTPQAKTEAHEIGHFFTLPHTFYGWEGTDAEAEYANSNVPSTIGNGWGAFSPENVPRTGSQANCNSEGDGFCGTEADYYSDRTNCPYFVTVRDPYGNNLDPDETNIMSYALDNCVTTFSADQQAAIAMDVAQRSWVSNTPNGTTDLGSLASPTPISPVNNGLLGSINNPTVRLDWTALTGAPWHYIEVYGTLIPGLWFVDVTDVIYQGYQYNGTSYFDLSTTNLQAGKVYAWRVTPISNYSTCALPSPYYKFEATAAATSIKDLPIHNQITFDLNANPVSTTYIPLSVYTAETIVASIRVYSLDGREMMAVNKLSFSVGDNILQLPAENILNGIYIAVLTTDRGTLQQKFVIQR